MKKQIAPEFGLEDGKFGDHNVEIFSDSQSGIALAGYTTSRPKTKHIDVKHCFVGEKIREGTFVLKKVDTKRNIADIFTKPPKNDTLEFFKKKIMVE